MKINRNIGTIKYLYENSLSCIMLLFILFIDL